MTLRRAVQLLTTRGGRAYRLSDEERDSLQLVEDRLWWVDDDGLVYPFRPVPDDVLAYDWEWESGPVLGETK